MAERPSRRTATRSVRAASILTVDSDALTQLEAPTSNAPTQYRLPPTVPSPFVGTLDASHDAILAFAQQYPQLRIITTILLQPVTRETHWSFLLANVLLDFPNGRELVEEIVFLVTRTLLPEQIAENRRIMARMYGDVKKSLSMRMILRYDMLREWTKRDEKHHIIIESKPPQVSALPPPAPLYNPLHPNRRPLMPNILSTLIAAPVGDYPLKKIGDSMKHHATELDEYLLLMDEVVAQWGAKTLLFMASSIVLQWQWLRENTEMMQDMEVQGWVELDGIGKDCMWIRGPDDNKEEKPKK